MNRPSPTIAGSPVRSTAPARPVEPFVVDRWRYDRVGGAPTVRFAYRVGDERFTEVLMFPEIVDIAVDDARVSRLVDILSVLAGVSYFKAFAPARVEYEAVSLDAAAQHLVDRAYDDGLREYAHHNGFAIPFVTGFPAPDAGGVAGLGAEPRERSPEHALVPFGGGKDSSLLARALRDAARTSLVTVGHNPYVSRVADTLGVPLLFATRAVDPRILASAANGYLNGHVPVTGINSLISLVLATAMGADAVVMANERSSSSDTVAGVNHQYSKSFEFERAVRGVLGADEPDYFSALRPWGDLAIARSFAAHPRLLGGFMSCNRAFVRDAGRRSDGWCGACDKCRSVYLSLAPFVERESLIEVFGHDLLDDPTSEAEWLRLVDAGNRPFDCVADVVEARQAFGLLAADARWGRTAVVRTMVAADVPLPLDGDVFAPSGEHAVPPAILGHLHERHFSWDEAT